MTASMDGFRIWPGRLDLAAQKDLCREVSARLELAPAYRPVTPGGRPMSVRMSNFGPLGWVTDDRGYRYQSHHPLTGQAWQGAGVMALFALGSGVSMLIGPWLWLRLNGLGGAGPGAPSRAGGDWGVRLAGLALASSAAWALWMGLAHNAAPWCVVG